MSVLVTSLECCAIWRIEGTIVGNLFMSELRGRPISLTTAQAIKAVEFCQKFSSLYRDIYLFRFNPLSGTIYILAEENIEVVIDQDGIWEFIE